MSILSSISAPARRPRAGSLQRPAPLKRSAWLRALVLGLAAALALLLVVASTHHHDSRLDAQACGVCAVLMDELPGAAGLPAPVVVAVAHAYLLAVAVMYACLHRAPPLLPPICGPPPSMRAARCRRLVLSN